MAQQSVTKIIFLIVVNLITRKARAKHEHLFNKLASQAVTLLNKISSLAADLSVKTFITIIAMNFGHTLLCCLSPT
jgi:hypothetical protein